MTIWLPLKLHSIAISLVNVAAILEELQNFQQKSGKIVRKKLLLAVKKSQKTINLSILLPKKFNCKLYWVPEFILLNRNINDKGWWWVLWCRDEDLEHFPVSWECPHSLPGPTRDNQFPDNVSLLRTETRMSLSPPGLGLARLSGRQISKLGDWRNLSSLQTEVFQPNHLYITTCPPLSPPGLSLEYF